MKTIRMNLSENALNNDEILAQEVASFLAKSERYSDFEADGNQVIEYDLLEIRETIYWTVMEIKRNAFNTFDIWMDC